MAIPTYSRQKRLLNLVQKPKPPASVKVAQPFATAGANPATSKGQTALSIDNQGILATQSLANVHNTGIIAASYIGPGIPGHLPKGIQLWPSQPHTLYSPSDGSTITLPTPSGSFVALTTPAVLGSGGTDQAYTFSNTMVYSYLIYDPTTQTESALISTSPTVAGIDTTNISGYTFFLPVGCGVVQSSNALLPFQQFGNDFFYTTQNYFGLSLEAGYTELNVSSLVPANAFAIKFMSPATGGLITVSFSVDGVNQYAAITNSGIPITVPMLNTGLQNQGQIYYTATAAMNLYVLGFTLNL